MENFALSIADVSIILGSLVLVTLIGVRASRNQDKTAHGYFLASGKLPWWLIGSAFVATSVSSEQIVGTVGATYKYGMGIANWEWFTLPAYTLLLTIFIPVYLKNRITTVPEFLSRRFGPICGDIYSWVMLLAYVLLFLPPILYGGSLAFSQLTGWNFYLILWGVVILAGIYTVKGGLASVVSTDAIQCLMLVGGGVVLYFSALGHIPGGWSAMETANPDRFHLYHPAGDSIAPFLGMLFGALGVSLFYQSTNQVMIQRVLGARSTWHGMMGILFAGFINFFRPLVTCFIGLIVFHWVVEMRKAAPLNNPDTTFPFALKTFAPQWGVRGIVLAGFLAAVMSATSALANSTATIFSLNVFLRLSKRGADDRLVVRVGQLASMVALVAGAVAAPSVEHFGGIFRYFQTGLTYLATPFVSVVLAGIFWKRTSYRGGLFGIVGGLVIQLTIALALPALGYNLHWLYVAFIAEVLTLAGIVGVSLFTAPPQREQWEPFHWSPGLLLGLDKSIVQPWYKSLKAWYALYAAIWVYLYWRFW